MNLKLILPWSHNLDQITSKSSWVLTEYLRIVTFCSVLQLSTWLAEFRGISTKLFQRKSFLVTHAMSGSVKWQHQELSPYFVSWNFFLCFSHYSAEKSFSKSTSIPLRCSQKKRTKQFLTQLGLDPHFSIPEIPSLPKRNNSQGFDMINRKYIGL